MTRRNSPWLIATLALGAVAAGLAPLAAMAQTPAPANQTWFRSMRLNVSDLDRSVAFYRDIVGIKLVSLNQGTVRHAVFTPSGVLTNDVSMFVLGADPKRTKPVDTDAVGWVSFAVTDVDAAVARAKAAGATVLREPFVAHEGRTRGAMLKDPDGFTVELMSFLREANAADSKPRAQ